MTHMFCFDDCFASQGNHHGAKWPAALVVIFSFSFFFFFFLFIYLFIYLILNIYELAVNF